MEKNSKVSEEIVAVITAAIEAATGQKVRAISIKRSDIWTMAGRRAAV
ncbi:hypothetical protein [Pectinatus frisingensis]|jgi:methylmalonyl-CoA carboxyltransferase large subunit|nr:hypothetical protein [Pectinatus frisingensis]